MNTKLWPKKLDHYKPYNTYPKEFKLEALRMMAESDRPASEIATKLGLRRNQLYKWKDQMTKKG
ncbi:MAG TPA: transposase, partial [Aquirhabdus sp.]